MRYLFVLAIYLLFTSSLASQCYPDRHSTSWFDGWVSCERAENPNAQRGLTHWILFDLSQAYELGEATIWNFNDPAHLNRGIRTALVDVSNDGINWYFVDTLRLSQAPGVSVYEGEQAFDFDGEAARFVLITAVENFGSEDCFGLSEIRVERSELTTSVEEEKANGCLLASVYPNPFVHSAKVQVNSDCSGIVEWQLTNVLGQIVDSGVMEIDGQGIGSVLIEGASYRAGQFVLHLQQGTESTNVQITKVAND